MATKSHVMMNVMSLQSSPMLIRDVDSGTLTLLLRFMYTGRVDVNGINPAKIMNLKSVGDSVTVILRDNTRPDQAQTIITFYRVRGDQSD